MRLAIVGDVHAHREELETTLQRVAESQVDRIILLGDLVDRGADPLGCLRLARTWTFQARSGKRRNLEVLLGNHEDAYVRAWRGLPKPGCHDVCEPGTQWLADRLDLDTLLWLESLPYVIEEPRLGVLCVHGGIDSTMLVPSDLDARVARVRYVDASGRAQPGFVRSAGARHWSEVYDGRFGLVVYGHQSWHEPRVMRHSLGVDGEGFGRLFAVVLSNENKDGVTRIGKVVKTEHKIKPKPLYQPVARHRRDQTRSLFAGMDGW